MFPPPLVSSDDLSPLTRSVFLHRFEAFDETWKHVFDTTYDKWEPYWGLFDLDRNLKSGLKIPDCGGKTVDSPFLL